MGNRVARYLDGLAFAALLSSAVSSLCPFRPGPVDPARSPGNPVLPEADCAPAHERMFALSPHRSLTPIAIALLRGRIEVAKVLILLSKPRALLSSWNALSVASFPFRFEPPPDLLLLPLVSAVTNRFLWRTG